MNMILEIMMTQRALTQRCVGVAQREGRMAEAREVEEAIVVLFNPTLPAATRAAAQGTSSSSSSSSSYSTTTLPPLLLLFLL